MKKYYALLLVFFGLGHYSATAQISFLQAESSLLSNMEVKSGYTKFCTDINGDYRDEIVALDLGRAVNVLSYTQENAPLYYKKSINVDASDEWTSGLIDLNNDGQCEFYSGGSYNNMKVFSIDEDFNFSAEAILTEELFAQGSSVVDINNDGFNDLFVCHDDAESIVFMNDTDGSLVRDDSVMDMTTVPASDNSGNYGVVWFDIDNDNDLDCYISKCRIGILDPLDPRRINALFINDGAGNFTEQAADFNLADGGQTWSTDYADFDNDGDFDLFIANHDVAHRFMINEGNQTFTEIIAPDVDGNPLIANTIQSICADLDNDGFADVLISGSRDIIYWNNGDLTFTLEENPFGTATQSACIGDMNQDGFLDVISSYQNQGFGDSRTDRIYLNETNDNHYVKFAVSGEEANKQGIGTKITVITADQTQINQLRGGTSYSAFNSLNTHFGLGTQTVIDSVIVQWPSGNVDVHENVQGDVHYLLYEGGPMNALPIIETDRPDICVGEQMTIRSDQFLIWNTGQVGDSIVVSQPGLYYGWRETGGKPFPSNKIRLSEAEVTPVVLNFDQEKITLCEGESVLLSDINGNEIIWSTGDIGSSLEINESGSYFGTTANACGGVFSDTLEIELVSMLNEDQDTVLMQTGALTLSAGKDSTRWYADAEGVNEIGLGADITVDINSDTSFYFQHYNSTDIPAFRTGPLYDSIVENIDFAIFFNQELFVEVDQPIVLESFVTLSEEEGTRTFLLTQSNGEIIDSLSVFFEWYEQKNIELNWLLEPGMTYTLTTLSSVNNDQFGTESPKLVCNKSGVSLPQTFNGMNILGSSIQEFYPYFFDMNIKYVFDSCESELYEYAASIVSSSSEIQQSDQVYLMPNPGTNEFRVVENLQSGEITHIDVYDQWGRNIISSHDSTGSILTQNWSSGMYRVVIQLDNQKRIVKNWLKQ